jgi:hypothetical protein
MNHKEYELACEEAHGDADTMLGAANMRIRTLERVLEQIVDTTNPHCPVDHPAFEVARTTLPPNDKAHSCRVNQIVRHPSDGIVTPRRLFAAWQIAYNLGLHRRLQRLTAFGKRVGLIAPSASDLRKRIADLEDGLRKIAVWSQEDQDDPSTCVMQWRGCVAIARQLLKPNDKAQL